MACQLIGYKGECLNILIRQGATFGPHEVTLLNPDNSPVILTDIFFRGQIRRTFDDPIVSATVSFVKTDELNGVFTFSIDATQTANLAAGNTENDALSKYVWDVEYVNETNIVTPLFYGDVQVFREVTR